MSEKEDNLTMSVIILAGGLIISNMIWLIGHARENNEAIRLGYKKYNQTTGNLEWVTNLVIKVELPVDKR